MKQLSTSISDGLYERIKKADQKDGRSVSNLAGYLLERGMVEWVSIYGSPDDDDDDPRR